MKSEGKRWDAIAAELAPEDALHPGPRRAVERQAPREGARHQHEDQQRLAHPSGLPAPENPRTQIQGIARPGEDPPEGPGGHLTPGGRIGQGQSSQ